MIILIKLLFTHLNSWPLTSSSSSSPGAPPKIENLPRDVSTKPGQPLSVAGVFSGDPAPSVQWVRSGQPLPDRDGRCRVETGTDLSTLVISAVKEADGGAYTLRLSNELGSASATVNVHVRSMWRKKKNLLFPPSFSPSTRTFYLVN